MDGLDSGSRIRGSAKKLRVGLKNKTKQNQSICPEHSEGYMPAGPWNNPSFCKQKTATVQGSNGCIQKLWPSKHEVLPLLFLSPPHGDDIAHHQGTCSGAVPSKKLSWWAGRGAMWSHASFNLALVLGLQHINPSPPWRVSLACYKPGCLSRPPMSAQEGCWPLMLLEHTVSAQEHNVPVHPYLHSHCKFHTWKETFAFGYCLLVCLSLTHLMKVLIYHLQPTEMPWRSKQHIALVRGSEGNSLERCSTIWSKVDLNTAWGLSS